MRKSPPSRWSRVGRGFGVASFSVFVAAMSHIVAGGHAPGILGIVLAVVFSTLAATAAIGRRLSMVRLVVSVAFSQAALHLLFSMNGSVSSPTLGHHEQFLAVAPTAASHGESPSMWVAHAIAGLVAIAALRAAQFSLGTIVTLPFIERILRVAALDVMPLAPIPVAPARAWVDALTPRLLESLVSRRGPPALAV